MKNKVFHTRLIILLAVIATTIFVTGCNCKSCKKDDDKTYYNNEVDPLVFSTQELDKVFNPFFSTTGPDSNVVGMTQIGMLGNDKNGNITYGDSEGVVTKDLQIVTEGTEDKDQTTTYYFVLKNNVKFSNGSALTIKDVLFNLYVYLDPAYTGSSTIYSTDIVGLKEYRTQEADETEQDSFKLKFQVEAEARIQALVDATVEILEEHGDSKPDKDQFREYLIAYAAEFESISDNFKNVVKDYDKAIALFKEELETDYNNSIDTYEDIAFSDKNGKVYKNLLTTDVEVFLYNEGYLEWNKEEAKLVSSLVNDPTTLKKWTKEQAINTIYADKIPNALEEVVLYWNTSIKLNDYLVNEAMEAYFQNDTNKEFPNISGIQFANRTSSVTVNNVTYPVPVYNADGSVKEGNEVLSIKIKDVDPKAIWNFAFSVAPMYYYSDAEHIAKFDYVSNFGVEYASQTFMNEVVNSPAKIGVPVGAGPYAASKSSGGLDNITAGDFYNLGIVYYERNPYHILSHSPIWHS